MALTKITGEGIGTTSGNLTVDVAGDIILKDGGTTVGTIGNDSTDLYIAGTTHGIKFDAIDASTMYIRPVNNSGTNLTGQIDLGQAGNVFRDAYVSGGVYFAPNAYPANYLDDYEEGTFTPVFSGAGGPTFSYQVGRYTKIGNRVIANLYVQISNKSTMSGAQIVSGLPFTSENISQNYNAGSIWMNSMDGASPYNGNQSREAFQVPNTNQIQIYAGNGSGGVTLLDASHMTNSTDMMLTVSYTVA